MSVWLTIPSARPPEEAEKVLKLWRQQGYKIALWRDRGDDGRRFEEDMVFGTACDYPGYAEAVNRMVADLIKRDPSAQWFVIGGDDVQPDLNHSAEEIAASCSGYFRGLYDGADRHFLRYTRGINTEEGWEQLSDVAETFGVMQPTGDRWGESPNHVRPDMRGAYIDRVCGSAWLGREFCKRVNGGNGPLWPEYKHMWVDEELQHVATKLGVLWQRRDLTQLHDHAARKREYSHDTDCPPHARKWTIGEEGRAHWKEAEKLFFTRRDAGFPGHEVL